MASYADIGAVCLHWVRREYSVQRVAYDFHVTPEYVEKAIAHYKALSPAEKESATNLFYIPGPPGRMGVRAYEDKRIREAIRKVPAEFSEMRRVWI